MALREKYQQVINVVQQTKMQNTSIEEQNGKLVIKGNVETVPEKNRIWDAIKTVPGWENELIADIRVSETGKAVWNTMQEQAKNTSGSGASAGGASTYTVKSGDTLSKIAKAHLGDANAYMEIFNANKDQLSDPDKIKPGQVLKIPQVAKHT